MRGFWGLAWAQPERGLGYSMVAHGKGRQGGPAVVPGMCHIFGTSALGHLCLKYCPLITVKKGVAISMGSKIPQWQDHKV